VLTDECVLAIQELPQGYGIHRGEAIVRHAVRETTRLPAAQATVGTCHGGIFG
jgi:hypothetical protein